MSDTAREALAELDAAICEFDRLLLRTGTAGQYGEVCRRINSARAVLAQPVGAGVPPIELLQEVLATFGWAYGACEGPAPRVAKIIADTRRRVLQALNAAPPAPKAEAASIDRKNLLVLAKLVEQQADEIDELHRKAAPQAPPNAAEKAQRAFTGVLYGPHRRAGPAHQSISEVSASYAETAGGDGGNGTNQHHEHRGRTPGSEYGIATEDRQGAGLQSGDSIRAPVNEESKPAEQAAAPVGQADVPPMVWLLRPKVQRYPAKPITRGVYEIEPTQERREMAEIDGDEFIEYVPRAALRTPVGQVPLSDELLSAARKVCIAAAMAPNPLSGALAVAIQKLAIAHDDAVAAPQPPQQDKQGEPLTEAQAEQLFREVGIDGYDERLRLVRAVERMHGIAPQPTQEKL